ncbi:MAG: inner membrane protein [Acidobacteriota bacterium]|jgi:inner membrane protein|nr:inner membrane protein [Acidobacteriota bacterium]
MDNLTHSLVGLVAAKAGLERLSPGATAVCVLAANAPDLDILATLGGKWFYLHNHRGITHSIIGTFTLALLIPALFYAGDQVLARIRKRSPRVKFRGLLIASLILSASHPLMDWTNNYGVRPLLPWSGQWFYGDLVFIVDPWIWLLLGGAAFLLTSKRTWQISLWATLALIITGFVLFLPLQNAGLLHSNIFRALWIAAIFGLFIARVAKLPRQRSYSIAVTALALIVVYWGSLAIAHRSALARAQIIAQQISIQNGEALNRVAAMPTLADPFRWQCVADTDRSVYRFYVSLSGNDEGLKTELGRYEKPQGREAEALGRASQDERARIFLDFARFPAARVEGDCLSGLLVEFADLRYTEPSASGRGTFSLDVPVACDTETGNKK